MRLRVASAMTLVAVALPGVCGPPLFTDDPNVVGKGRTELIVSASAMQRRGDQRSWSAPTLDLTYGPTSWLDLGLQSVLTSGSADADALAITASTKWALVQAERVTLALAPAGTVDTKAPGEESVFVPLELELRFGRWAVGGEAGYRMSRSADDDFQAGAYVARRPIPWALLLAEVYVHVLDPGHDAGASIGAEISVADELLILIGAGTGLEADDVSRVDWTAYLGLQKNF